MTDPTPHLFWITSRAAGFAALVLASLADVAIPLHSSYKTFWTSLGIVGGWGLALLGLPYYARRWVGAARWCKLHRFTALAWLAGLVHALGEGTDAGQLWFLAMIAVVAIPALALLATRMARSGGAGAPAPQRSKSRPSGPTLTTGVVPITASEPQH